MLKKAAGIMIRSRVVTILFLAASAKRAGGFSSTKLPSATFAQSSSWLPGGAPSPPTLRSNRPGGLKPLTLHDPSHFHHGAGQPKFQQHSRFAGLHRFLNAAGSTVGRSSVRLASVGGVGDGSGGKGERRGVLGRLKQLHNPVTYIVLALLAGLKWDWCFRSPYYWFGVAFCVKWYRARYVFKIPVWDRQPNWNNIITSKEQEKDLKAYTCKNCGSTLFIAKSREFFFEGGTGIGGLGCFSCGAKGKDNFVMDRDRIVEDVADIDDYFEYERPLDFVSAAERRKLLKEAGGDEDKANLLLLERTTGMKSEPEGPSAETAPSAKSETLTDEVIDVQEIEESSASDPLDAAPSPPKQSPKPKPPKPSSGDDDFDLLGLDG